MGSKSMMHAAADALRGVCEDYCEGEWHVLFDRDWMVPGSAMHVRVEAFIRAASDYVKATELAEFRVAIYDALGLPVPARSLMAIANEVLQHWRPAGAHAMPYLTAMRRLNKMTDVDGGDSAEEIVMKFLSNATHWRGPVAQRIKAELRAMLPKEGR